MTKAEAMEFGFVDALPRREKSRWQRVWEHFEECRRITDAKGMLVPLNLAAEIGGVSHQRISQLCESGLLERVEVAGRPFVTEASLVTWAKSERKTGHYTELPKFKEMAGMAWRFAHRK